MQILLDTHIFLWFALNDFRLSMRSMNHIKDFRNDKYLSIASLWEISIKCGLGKLTLDAPFSEFVERNVHQKGITILQASVEHLAVLQHLPQHHRDPFDRLIIAQSIVEHIGVITIDPQFEKYGIDLIR
jgi:PIN domain nuclease of toxin-antitoxin system